MENQHRKIKGYRELSQAEIDLMNRIKEKGNEFGALLEELKDLTVSKEGLGLTTDQVKDRFANLDYATKDGKQAVMWAVRAVALPDSF